MSRETDVERILFPVELRDIYYTARDPHQAGLFDGREGGAPRFVPVSRYKAVVNVDTGRAISVVGLGYRLVTNREALALGEQCFRLLFRTVDTKDMAVFNVVAPQSGSFCHVDIIHKEYVVNVWAQEVWVPYIRVTNSYNRLRALRFDLGFCRKLCNNGVIFERETIQYKFDHTKQAIAPEGEFAVDFSDLKRLEVQFLEYMHNLRRYYVPETYVLPIVCKALRLQFDTQTPDQTKRARELERLALLKDAVNVLTRRYYGQLGPNAYALLSVLSDFSSRPSIYRNQTVMIHNLQKRTGRWIESFIEEIGSKGFRFEDYLQEHLALADD